MYPTFLKRPQNILIYEITGGLIHVKQIDWSGYEEGKEINAHGVVMDKLPPPVHRGSEGPGRA